MKQTPQLNQNSRNAILFITILASFLIPFMTSSLNIALPDIGREFNLDVITLSWVTSAFILGSASLLVPFGRLADMYGRRRIFLYGNVIFTIGSGLAFFANSGAMLLIDPVVQGIGGAAIFSNSIAILTSAFPATERGKVLGINTATVYLGLSLGPVLGGLMTEFLGWRSIFIFCASICVIVILLILGNLKHEFETNKERFDFPGTILYSLALILLMYGLSELPALAGFLILGTAIIIGGVFIWWELHTASPLINLTIFRQNRGFAFSNLAALVNYSGTWSVGFLLSLYLQNIKNLSAETAGLILVASPAVQALLSPAFGRLSDRVEPRILVSAGMAATAAGIAMLAFLSPATPLVYIIGAQGLLGFGFALFASPNTNAIMSSVEPKLYGFASAMLATMRQLGMTLSMGVVMVVFAVIIGRVKIAPENHTAFLTSTHIIFAIAAGSCGSAIFASMARGNIHEAGKTANR